MRLISLRSSTFALIALLLFGLALLLGPSPRASAAAETSTRHVYVMNNNLVGPNSITIFNRASNGSLTQAGTSPIGGNGSAQDFKSGSQGSMIITPQGTRLFAVDAGSNQISVVNASKGHLSLMGVFPSGGPSPISLTYQNGLLYVLNAGIANPGPVANVTGFQVDSLGVLHPIPGSTRPLSTSHPDPAQVQIDLSHQFLLVTEKGTNLIDVYHIQSNGSLTGPTTFPSKGAVPFGMAFDPASTQNEFVVSDAMGGSNGTGAATAYKLVNGSVQLLNGPVANKQKAPCWTVVTHNGHFAYTANADSQSITGYSISSSGVISLLNSSGITGTTPSNTFPIEEALSSSSQFLYVLDTRVNLNPPGPATISGFLIHSNGSLTSVVNSSQISLPVSAVGLAAD